MVLWYIADGCVIIRGIHWLSYGAAILPSGGRGASTGVDHPTAALFQVPLSWKEKSHWTKLEQTVLFLCQKRPIK